MAPRFTSEEVVLATGARKSGAPVAAFDGVTTDTRAPVKGGLFVALVGERFDAHDFLAGAVQGGAIGLVVLQGRGAMAPAGVAVFEVPDTQVALGALARLHRRRFSIPIGAVTGSNGKTTTKELIGSILATRGNALKTQGNLNNEIGVPLTLFGLEATHAAAIVEMGMNHAGEIERLTAIAEPDAGLITVVQPAHLEGLGSLEGVAKAKGELFRGLSAKATAVVNLDDPRVAAQAQGIRARRLTFGRAAGADVRLIEVTPLGFEGQRLTLAAQGKTWSVTLFLVGAHNAMNATGAFAMGLALGVAPEDCVRGLEAARAHARRLEIAKLPTGVTVVDDCYNANPSSMTAALETLGTLAQGGRPIAVLGDMLELGAGEAEAHAAMGPTAAIHARRVAFFGPRMRAAYERAKASLGDSAAHFEDVAPLVAWVTKDLHSGDVVLVKGSRGMRLERVVEGLTGAKQGAH